MTLTVPQDSASQGSIPPAPPPPPPITTTVLGPTVQQNVYQQVSTTQTNPMPTVMAFPGGPTGVPPPPPAPLRWPLYCIYVFPLRVPASSFNAKALNALASLAAKELLLQLPTSLKVKALAPKPGQRGGKKPQ